MVRENDSGKGQPAGAASTGSGLKAAAGAPSGMPVRAEGAAAALGVREAGTTLVAAKASAAAPNNARRRDPTFRGFYPPPLVSCPFPLALLDGGPAWVCRVPDGSWAHGAGWPQPSSKTSSLRGRRRTGPWLPSG